MGLKSWPKGRDLCWTWKFDVCLGVFLSLSRHLVGCDRDGAKSGMDFSYEAKHKFMGRMKKRTKKFIIEIDPDFNHPKPSEFRLKVGWKHIKLYIFLGTKFYCRFQYYALAMIQIKVNEFHEALCFEIQIKSLIRRAFVGDFHCLYSEACNNILLAITKFRNKL